MTVRELRNHGGEMIASIAIANAIPLYTSNAADFEGADDLEVVVAPRAADEAD